MISEEQMKHILEALQASFMALLTEMQRNWGPASRENKRKQIEQRITEFVYDPEGGVNFEAWFRKYEGLFEKEGAELDDKTKVEIILLKLAQREHERSEEELTQRLDQVVDNLLDYGLKINMEKSEFLRKEIHYLGFIVNDNGRAPDPERVKAFLNMKVPKNTKELRSFMGLVSYKSPFITGLHSLKPPLRRLLCKDVEFIWSPECQNAFDAIKTKICDSTMLSRFEADKETIVQADASDYGLGGVLLQKDADGRVQPIMHAARSLTKAERNYSQIEKEALAIIFAVQRFHLFIYGRPFTLHTDHQPLKFLWGANRGVPQNIARRIQRWSTILQNYAFQIQYVSTQKFGVPDALSRLSTGNENQGDMVVASTLMQDDDKFRGVIRQLPLTAEHIRATTAADPLLRQVKESTRNGWLSDDKVHPSIKPFRNRKEQLYITEDCIMCDGKVVISARYQQ
nr:unnamed protein product [Spirometra erinaceieuropaei]